MRRWKPSHFLLQIFLDVVELTEVVDRSTYSEVQILQTQEEELCNGPEFLAFLCLFDGFGVDRIVLHQGDLLMVSEVVGIDGFVFFVLARGDHLAEV